MRRNIAVITVGVFLILIICALFFWNEVNSKAQNLNTDTSTRSDVASIQTTEPEPSYKELTEQEILDHTLELLSIFHTLYYITQDDTPDALTDSEFIMSMMTETLNDKNKLDNLTFRAQTLAETENQVVSVTGMGLFLGLTALSESHQSFVNFLRSVDTDNADLAEFRYQIALFQSSNKDAFNTIIEGTMMYPYVFVKFAEEEKSENTFAISETAQQKIKDEIERLFADIFIEDEQWYEETGNRNAVVLIVGNYRDFITSE